MSVKRKQNRPKPSLRKPSPQENLAFQMAVKYQIPSTALDQLKMLAFLALNAPLENNEIFPIPAKS